MANQEHVEAVRGGAEAVRVWREANPGLALDLTGADLRGARLAHANLDGASLQGALLHGADFTEASLAGANFEDASGLADTAGLETTSLASDARHTETCRLPWTERLCDWERLRRFGRLPLFAVSYTALLIIPIYVYSLALYNQKIEAARHWAEGVEARQRAAARPERPPALTGLLRKRAAALAAKGEELKRQAEQGGKDPALVAAVADVAGAAGDMALAVNEIESLVGGVGAGNDVADAVDEMARTVRERLKPARVDWRIWVALFSTVLLAAASTLYVLFCPKRVQEFSRTVWCDQLGKPLLHYWATAWQHRGVRLLCMALYLTGGPLALALIAVKLVDTFWVIVRYTH